MNTDCLITRTDCLIREWEFISCNSICLSVHYKCPSSKKSFLILKLALFHKTDELIMTSKIWYKPWLDCSMWWYHFDHWSKSIARLLCHWHVALVHIIVWPIETHWATICLKIHLGQHKHKDTIFSHDTMLHADISLCCFLISKKKL